MKIAKYTYAHMMHCGIEKGGNIYIVGHVLLLFQPYNASDLSYFATWEWINFT